MVLIKKGNRYRLKFAIYAYKTINIADIIMQKAIFKACFQLFTGYNRYLAEILS